MLFLVLAAAVVPAAAGLAAHACPDNSTNRQSVSPKIIVQGGIQPNTNPGSQLAIGPKQDDPAQPKPGAASGQSMVAIGPKQDDPAQPKPGTTSGRSMLTIGPKQDDPAQPGRRIASSAAEDCGTAPMPAPGH